ncbi:CaiB/BaiF CoA transferase family protein [Limobrevibacterium gyesilva]|uniref:CoA transferase n=1 Tax=Limobrevibacterium gyesilva TaxID=2991712 RepID=A0AA41YIA6_9PROT|nr:CoA transferase [Limobrevibacterium gyesilva]MCW3474036.1 CoA transferase [Limobrevibacterium gyesilva]
MVKQRDFAPQARPPLSGLRVIDMSRLVAGNMVSLQLADHGAEVIKIEDPQKGDPLRAWRVGGHSIHWKVYARNKKSLALSLRHPDGLALLRDLIATADVLIENFRPGTMEEMGLAPDALWETNPKLIVVRISGFGQDGPYRERPGFGSLVEGMSGFAAMNGFADREPVLPPLALADMIAGLYGAYAVMIARREVEHGGAGQVIDLPLLDPIVSILGPQAESFRTSGALPQRTGSRSQTTSPRNVFRTRDGRWIAISASIQTMAERLLRVVGREDMIADPRFATNTARVQNAEACEQPIVDFIAARTFADVMDIFEREQITAAPVYDVDQLIADPHVVEREVLVDLPDAEMGQVMMHNVVPRLSATPGAIRTPAPKLGEHTRALLSALGCDSARLEALAARGVIRAG